MNGFVIVGALCVIALALMLWFGLVRRRKRAPIGAATLISHRVDPSDPSRGGPGSGDGGGSG